MECGTVKTLEYCSHFYTLHHVFQISIFARRLNCGRLQTLQWSFDACSALQVPKLLVAKIIRKALKCFESCKSTLLNYHLLIFALLYCSPRRSCRALNPYDFSNRCFEYDIFRFWSKEILVNGIPLFARWWCCQATTTISVIFFTILNKATFRRYFERPTLSSF